MTRSIVSKRRRRRLRGTAREDWPQQEVVPAYDAMKADPSRTYFSQVFKETRGKVDPNLKLGF